MSGKNRNLGDLGFFFLALLLAILAGGLIILATGANPLTAYTAGLRAALGAPYRVLNTLTNTTVLVLTGLACSVAFRSGIWNIGVEGQLYVGGFCAALTGQLAGLPTVFHLPLVILAAVCAGMAWAAGPGLLRTTRGTNEIVVTLMLNYLAVLLTSYLVNYPFKAAGTSWPETVPVQASVQLPYLYPLTRFSASFFVAVAVLVLVLCLFRRTLPGYAWGMVGQNPRAAALGGLDPKAAMLGAMLISGGVAGLAGGLEVVGIRYRFMDGFSPGYGMTGILIALIARNDPLKVLLVAVIFAMLKSGATGMELATDVPAELSEVLQTLIVLFLAAQIGLTELLNRLRGSRPARETH